MKRKLLLTGASGFLGYHLLRVFAPEWEVYGIGNCKGIEFAGATSIKCDITNYIELGNYFDDIEPDAVLHTAAISDANFCQQNPALAYNVNVDASKNLAGICSDFQIPFAYTSTDLVFDGKKGMYTETDEKNPLSVYGSQKAKAEDEILNIYPESTIFRLPVMFGYPNASTGNYLYNLLKQLNARQPANLFNDEYRSVGGAMSISKGMLQLLEKGTGIIHLAGRERLSRYDFGIKAAAAFGFSPALLKEGSQKDVTFAAPRPADVSLDISKALGRGYAPLSVDDELTLIANGKYF